MVLNKTNSVKKLQEPIHRELNEATWKVLLWFFSYPKKEFGLNDLVEELEISKTTAHKVVEKLLEIGFLKREIIGKMWRISCNREHEFNTTKKIPFNLEMIYESRMIPLIQQEIGEAKAIILFGSYRKGDDTEESDIDIAVERFDRGETQIEETTLARIGYRENVKVQVTIFSRETIDPNLFANIANGIVLAGFLEVRP